MLLARGRHRARRATVDQGRPRSDGAALGGSCPLQQRKSVGCSAMSAGSGRVSAASSQSTGLSEGRRLMLPPSSMLQILEGDFSGKLAKVLLVNAAQGQYKVRVVPDDVVTMVSCKDVQLAPISEPSTSPGNRASSPGLAPIWSPRLEDDIFLQAASTQTVLEQDVTE
ncbi:unnamed protein product [Prorocentrum cordatum]|uniref:Uncharacterized protein n=2 Tax=Prorocentrum cordatum TaxID=2364126 RepID=A0ABN9SD50_9DINO|nr:unnamed protein product [Polarella glacialis]